MFLANVMNVVIFSVSPYIELSIHTEASLQVAPPPLKGLNAFFSHM